MKKIALTSLATILLATAANASVSPYASIKAGWSSTSMKFFGDTETINNFGGGVAAGASLSVSPIVSIRGEAEYSYLTGKKDVSGDSIKLSRSLILANVYADFGDSSWLVKPYVGISAGYAIPSIKGSDSNGSIDFKPDGAFTYGASIGASYAVDKNLSIDLGARYLMAGTKIFDVSNGVGKVDMDINDLSVMIGARYAF
jgi:opacity protein-like surface antigen